MSNIELKKNNRLNNKLNNKLSNNKLSNNKLSNKIIQIKNSSRSNISNFPKYIIEGGSGFQCVKFILKSNEVIRADGGAMNYMTPGITLQTTSGKSWTNTIIKGLGRAISGSSIFYNIFSNTTDKEQIVQFSGVSPGNIGCFYIPSKTEFNIVHDSYICSTENLDVGGKVRFGGILLGYGLTFVTVKAPENSPGLIWIAAFGDVIEYKLKPTESIIVDNGVFLGFDSEISINTKTVGGLKSFFFSGEGLVSEMKNNTQETKSIFLQSRSRIFYNDYIKKICAVDRLKNSVTYSTANSIFSSIGW